MVLGEGGILMASLGSLLSPFPDYNMLSPMLTLATP